MSKELIKEEKLDNDKVIMQTYHDFAFHRDSYEIVLPKITTEELIERYKKIKPIVKIEDIYYLLKEFATSELNSISYIWNKNDDKREIVDESKIETIGEFSCYHTYGYHGIFKPSIGEVLSQFPDDLLKEANSFYLYQTPEDVNDLNSQKNIVGAGCHKSKVKAIILKK